MIDLTAADRMHIPQGEVSMIRDAFDGTVLWEQAKEKTAEGEGEVVFHGTRTRSLPHAVFYGSTAAVGGAPGEDLPAGYREVEYIENTGLESVDTGLAVRKGDSISAVFELKEWTDADTDGTYNYIYGSPGNEVFLTIRHYLAKADVWRPRFASASWASADVTDPIGTKFSTELYAANFYVDGVQVTRPVHGNNYKQDHLMLFGYSYSGSFLTSKMKLYGFQKENDGTVVQKLVPCVRLSDQQAGLYDTVGSVFLGNIGGGRLIAGPAPGAIQCNDSVWEGNDGEQVSLADMPLRAVGTTRDTYDSQTGTLIRRTGFIASYAGEDVGDSWISSTGALDTGAQVVYVLPSPVQTAEEAQPLTQKRGENQLTQTSGSIAETEIAVTYLGRAGA